MQTEWTESGDGIAGKKRTLSNGIAPRLVDRYKEAAEVIPLLLVCGVNQPNVADILLMGVSTSEVTGLVAYRLINHVRITY